MRGGEHRDPEEQEQDLADILRLPELDRGIHSEDVQPERRIGGSAHSQVHPHPGLTVPFPEEGRITAEESKGAGGEIGGQSCRIHDVQHRVEETEPILQEASVPEVPKPSPRYPELCDGVREQPQNIIYINQTLTEILFSDIDHSHILHIRRIQSQTIMSYRTPALIAVLSIAISTPPIIPIIPIIPLLQKVLITHNLHLKNLRIAFRITIKIS